MKKIAIVFIVGLFVLFAGIFYYFNNQKPDQTQEQRVLEQTLVTSQKYSTLRYRTEKVLDIRNYSEYDSWNSEMTDMIQEWKTLENDSLVLKKLAIKIEMEDENVSFNLFPKVLAYTKEEVTNIVDKAPMGKKISTLANHLGVDAKMAQLILNETQNMISREAYGEEGDVFETCEQNSMRIKNGAKVSVFVGGVVLSGGTSAIATGGALAKTTLVVTGADLVLEVTEDEAKIALGDKNKVSEMVGTFRTVTEPVASILTITNIPRNLSKTIDKLDVLSFGVDQVISVVEDDKILGISIKTNQKGEITSNIAGLTEVELPEWMKENNVVKSNESVEEILKIVKPKEIEKEENSENSGEELNNNTNQDNNEMVGEIVGVWKGEMKWTPSAEEVEQSKSLVLEIKADGTANAIGGTWNSNIWKQEGNVLRFYSEDNEYGYHEFILNGNILTFVKIAGPDMEDPSQWAEVLAGSDFFGGKYMEITMVKE